MLFLQIKNFGWKYFLINQFSVINYAKVINFHSLQQPLLLRELLFSKPVPHHF